MNLLGTTIEKGSTHSLDLNIAKLHTGTSLSVPVIVQRAQQDGPCLLLTAGIHGDEINGVEIVRQMVANGYHQPTAGTLICMPVINVFGFLNQERDFPDGRDLNRMFPGSKRGSLASRFAYYLMHEIVPHIDYCIDYHTGGDKRFNYAQIRIDAQEAHTLDLAKVFGVKFIKDAETRDKSFRKTLAEQGKKVLLFEGGKSLHLDRTVTNCGIDGTLRVMQHLGMRNFEKELLQRRTAEVPQPKLIRSSTWLRAKRSGMFRSNCQLGSFVQKNQMIGSISDPYGKFEIPVKAHVSGYIICVNHAPLVNQGAALFHLSKKIDEVF